MEILQQMLTVLTQDDCIKDPDALQFLQPFFNFVLLQPLAHTENLVAARELYFSLASLVSLSFVVGTALTRLLTHYMYHFTSKTTEVCEMHLLFPSLFMIDTKFIILKSQPGVIIQILSCVFREGRNKRVTRVSRLVTLHYKRANN